MLTIRDKLSTVEVGPGQALDATLKDKEDGFYLLERTDLPAILCYLYDGVLYQLGTAVQ